MIRRIAITEIGALSVAAAPALAQAQADDGAVLTAAKIAAKLDEMGYSFGEIIHARLGIRGI